VAGDGMDGPVDRAVDHVIDEARDGEGHGISECIGQLDEVTFDVGAAEVAGCAAGKRFW